MRLIAASALALLCFVMPAHAGPHQFGALDSPEVIGDHNVELESRLADDNDVGDLHARSTAWWISPTVGLSDRIELRLPVEMTWRSEIGTQPGFTLSRFGADIRYQLAALALLRVGVARDVEIRNLAHLELGVVAAHDLGSVRVSADAALTFEANRGGVHFDVRPTAGLSVEVKPNVHVGAEAFGVRSFDSAVESWAAVGPNIAWTYARFWFASSFGVGVYNVSSAARVVWGIGF
jgi:hypothetical protein